MKLTQKTIATLEQAHDALLMHNVCAHDSDLLVSLRSIKRDLADLIGDNHFAFAFSDIEIGQIYKDPEKIKEIAPELLFDKPEIGKWYKVTTKNKDDYYLYIREYTSYFEFEGWNFLSDGSFQEGKGEVNKYSDYRIAYPYEIHSLFTKESIRRGFPENEVRRTDRNGSSHYVNGNLVFKNGYWLNDIMEETKKLEKKHNLKIKVTFE